MLESIKNSLTISNSTNLPEYFGLIFISLILSTAFSWFIAWVYLNIRKSEGCSQSFVQTLIMVSVIVTSVMAIIGNDLARAFGLVGAVSIIRFRTKVKDPLDTAFLFAVISVGMANGLKLYGLSLITTLFISGLIYLLHRSGFGSECKEK